MASTLVCSYPGCAITAGLERCSECGKIACPQHRTLRNGTYVCLTCDETRAAKVEEERQEQARQAEQAQMAEERRARQAIAERAIALHRGATAEKSTAYPTFERLHDAVAAEKQATPAAPREVTTNWKVRPVIFGLGLLSLFLPFIAVSCNGQTVATANGFQVATGYDASDTSTSSGVSSRSAPSQGAQHQGGEPLAVLAIIVVFAGLAFGFWHTKQSAILSAIAGVIGVITLLALKSKIDGDAQRQTGGLLQIDYRAGFWLLLSLFVVAAGYNGYLLMDLSDEAYTNR